MAKTIEFKSPSGRTLKVELFPYGSDTIANGATGDTATEYTNRKGLYSATFTESLIGWHHAIIKQDGVTIIGVYDVYLDTVDGVYRCEDVSHHGVSMIQSIIDDLEDGGRLDLILDQILLDSGTNIPALINALENLSSADVETVVSSVLNTNTIPELSSTPEATPTITKAIMLLYMWLRNQKTVTASELALYNSAGTKIISKQISDNGSQYTEQKAANP